MAALLDGRFWRHPGLCSAPGPPHPTLGKGSAPRLPGTLGIKRSGPSQGPTRPSGPALDVRTGWIPVSRWLL